MNELFTEMELDLIGTSCNVILDLGVEEGQITNEEERNELLETLVDMIVVYKDINARDREMDLEEICNLLGTYAKIRFKGETLEPSTLEELNLYLALLLTNVDNYEDVVEASTAKELITIFNNLEDRDDNDIKRVAVLRQAHDILNEDELEEFFDGIRE